jgi:hypothetical protein
MEHHVYSVSMACRNALLRPHVTWIDNFSHIYKNAVQHLLAGAYSSCQWTGTGLHRTMASALSDFSVAVVLCEDGTISHAMPDMIFTEDQYDDIMKKMEEVMELDTEMFEKSHSRDIRTVPLLVGPAFWTEDGGNVDYEVLNAVKTAGNFTDRFVPAAVDPINIGSNAGVCRVARAWIDAERPRRANGTREDAKKYSFVMADVNIFHRLLKVHTHTRGFP